MKDRTQDKGQGQHDTGQDKGQDMIGQDKGHDRTGQDRGFDHFRVYTPYCGVAQVGKIEYVVKSHILAW